MTDMLTLTAVVVFAGATIAETVIRNRERREATIRHLTLSSITQAANVHARTARDAAQNADKNSVAAMAMLMELTGIDEVTINGRTFTQADFAATLDDIQNLPETDGCDE